MAYPGDDFSKDPDVYCVLQRLCLLGAKVGIGESVTPYVDKAHTRIMEITHK